MNSTEWYLRILNKTELLPNCEWINIEYIEKDHLHND